MTPGGVGVRSDGTPQDVMAWAVPSLCGLLLARALPCIVARTRALQKATRLSDDPQRYWQLPRRRLPSRAALVCRRHFRIFRQVADTSPPRAEGNHPNPCLPWRVRPLLMALDDKDKIRRRSASTITPQPLRDLPQQDILILFCCRTYQASSHEAGTFETVMGLAARLRRRGDEFHMSKVVQLRAAIAPRGFALPQHLNLMSSDAGNRAGSAGLAIVLAHPNDAVA